MLAFGQHALSLVLRTRRIRPLRGLINQNIAVRRTALKSTWPEGPCAILSIAVRRTALPRPAKLASKQKPKVPSGRRPEGSHNQAEGLIMLLLAAFGSSKQIQCEMRARGPKRGGQLTRSNLHSKYYVNRPRISKKGRPALWHD